MQLNIELENLRCEDCQTVGRAIGVCCAGGRSRRLGLQAHHTT